ncbi:MAG: class I mannose-6-phosphate isomerase [Bdellovibrionales bacterium]|nr:class I mannose-6-phosphate isomerase [Bdellovibrionales bacterium]
MSNYLKTEGLLLLSPHLVSKVWGGQRFGKGIGETWEISSLEQGPSLFNETPLNEICAELSYLVKYIDTQDNLSVQVHPDDEYALRVENQRGKTECWLVLEAEPKAGLYLGLRPGVDKTTLTQSIHSQEDVSKLLNFVPVKAGDFFVIPAGTIHAIGKGVFLAEVQQSSGLTYRVWDWNRGGRELHIQKAMDVIEFSPEKNNLEYFRYRENVLDSNGVLFSHADFTLGLYSWARGEQKKIEAINRPVGIVCLKGSLEVFQRGQTQNINKGESLLINKKEAFLIKASDESKFLLIS